MEDVMSAAHKTATQRIGFIGAGLMGHGMVKNLLKKGFTVTLMGHQNRAPIDDLVKQGAVEVETPKAVAQASTLVILCLPNSDIVHEVVLGPDGLLAGAHDGLLVADSTTGDPERTKQIATALAEHGVAMLDAPMTMTPKEAQDGALNVLVGGSAANVERARPAFEAYARNVFHVGPLGSAHALKLINNFLSLTTAAMVAEAVTTARASGVDLAMFREVLSAGAVNSGMLQKMLAQVVDGDSSGLQFAMVNARKDTGYYVKVAESHHLTSPFGTAAHQIYTLACSMGHGGRHVPYLSDVMSEWGGVK
jgi:hypothetical protein